MWMCAINAAGSCGWNADIFIAIRDLALSPLSLSLSYCVLDEATVFSRVDFMNLDVDVRNRRGWFLRFEPWSFHCNPRSCSRVLPSFCAEFTKSIWIWMASVDAASSSGWNPGLFIAIGRLVVEYTFSPLFHAEFIASS
jgi:hypothetical protein